MQFKDLVAKLDELIGGTPGGVTKIPANAQVQKNPLGTGAGGLNVAQNAIQAAQAAQGATATPPAEKPIPGQQPNLGPKPSMTSAPPQQVIGAQPQPAQQNQQANGGMAAAILQAVNQMKTQQPSVAPTTSQSIANQQQQAVSQAKGLQQTAKPGEPLEEQNKTPGLSDKDIKNWVFSLSKDPSNITHPEWKYIDKDSKVKILKTVKAEHPTVSNYIDIQRKIAKERKSDAPDNDYIAQLEKDKLSAWQAHYSAKKETPATNRSLGKSTDTASGNTTVAQQQQLTQTLGAAMAAETDPAKKAQFMKDYEAAAAKLTDMKKGDSTIAIPRHPKFADGKKGDDVKPPATTNGKKGDDVKSPATSDGQTFGQAFAAARKKAQGPDGRFTWTNPKTGETDTYNTAYKDEVKKTDADKNTTTTTTTYTPPTTNNTVASVVVPDNTPVSTAPTKASDGGPALTPAQLKWMGNADQTDPHILARMRSAVPDTTTSTTANSTTSTPAEPNTDTSSNSWFKNIFKKDTQGKTYVDPFNVGPTNSVIDKQLPGDGPTVRDATAKTVNAQPVKEVSLQSVVDELLNENTVSKEDTASTASKWATKSAKLAPWVGNVAKGANAAMSASDIADYSKKGDKVGAGIASAALAADAVGTVFPPASWASFALDAANAGRDVYLKQTGQDYKDPDMKQIQAKEELSNIVNLAKYKVDKK